MLHTKLMFQIFHVVEAPVTTQQHHHLHVLLSDFRGTDRTTVVQVIMGVTLFLQLRMRVEHASYIGRLSSS